MNAFVKLRQKISPYLFLVPCLIVFGLFLFYPFAKTIYLSLYKTDKLGQAKLFVGFGNYIDLFTSESFYNSLLVTLIFVVIVVMVSMLLGLVTALLVNKNFPGIRVFSTAYAADGDRLKRRCTDFRDYVRSDDRHSRQIPAVGHQLAA